MHRSLEHIKNKDLLERAFGARHCDCATGGLFMRIRILMLLALASAAPALAVETKPAAAVALPETLKGDDVAAFVQVLQAEGYRAKVETASDGSTFISSAAGGTNISIYFDDCKIGTGCSYIRLTSWWEKPKGASAEAMNKWNNGWKMIRAVYDDDKDVVIDYYYTLAGGVSRANFVDMFEWYASISSDFSDYLSELETPTPAATSKK